MASNAEEDRGRRSEILRQLGLIREKMSEVYCRIGRIEMERLRNSKSDSPSVSFDMQCQAELEVYREQERELKERFSIQSDML